MTFPQSIAVLSIPGLPNGFMPLTSTWYHNYKPALKTIQSAFERVTKTAPKVHFQDYVWPREVRHPWGDWNRWIPGLAIPTYYAAYQHVPTYRDKVVEGAAKRLRKAFKASPWVFLILHSHGNRVGLDAIKSLHRQGEIPQHSRIFVISLAPAYSGVGFGLVPEGLDATHLQAIRECFRGGLFTFRIQTDLLSGAPPALKKSPATRSHSFPPRWYEPLFLAHGSVRSRQDVLQTLHKDLVSALSV